MFTFRPRFFCYVFLLPLLAAFTFSITGCGDDEESHPEASITGVPQVPRTPLAPDAGDADSSALTPAGSDVEMGDIVPSTRDVLRLMPDDAQLAIGIPPAAGLLARVEPILKAVLPPEDDVDAIVAEFFADLGEEVGVQADSLESLAGALGVDQRAPMAVFVDYRGVVASARAARNAAEAEERSGNKPLTSDGGALLEAPDLLGSADDSPVNYIGRAENPRWLAVLKPAEPEKATAHLERLAGEQMELAAVPLATDEFGGVTAVTRGDYGYFTADGYLVFGDLALLRGAAARVAKPATIRYGTSRMPAAAEDEIVVLLYGGRARPLLEQALPLMAADDIGVPLIAAQLDLYGGAFPERDDDPVAVTLSISRERVEMRWRLDTETHPDLLNLAGPARPLRLAPYLPETTLALLSFRFNDALKAQVMDKLLPAMAARGEAGRAVLATQLMTQLGDEITVGIAPAAEGPPSVYVLLGLAEPETTRGIAQIFLSMSPVGDHEGIEIYELETSLEMPVYFSFIDDSVVASNSEDDLKALIGRYRSGKESELFTSTEPPFDLDVPRYQASVIDTSIVERVATALNAGEALPEAHRTPLLTAVRQIRTNYEFDDGWLQGGITVYLGDLEEASRLRAAGATPEPAAEP